MLRVYFCRCPHRTAVKLSACFTQGHERLCFSQKSMRLHCWSPLPHSTCPSSPSLPSPPILPGPHPGPALRGSIGMGDRALRLKAEIPLGLRPHSSLSLCFPRQVDEIPSWTRSCHCSKEDINTSLAHQSCSPVAAPRCRKAGAPLLLLCRRARRSVVSMGREVMTSRDISFSVCVFGSVAA